MFAATRPFRTDFLSHLDVRSRLSRGRREQGKHFLDYQAKSPNSETIAYGCCWFRWCVDLQKVCTGSVPFILRSLFAKLGQTLKQLRNFLLLPGFAQRLNQAVNRGLILGIDGQGFPALLDGFLVMSVCMYSLARTDRERPRVGCKATDLFAERMASWNSGVPGSAPFCESTSACKYNRSGSFGFRLSFS